MDHAVVRALKEKRELQKRLAEIDQFLRLYREFSGPSDSSADDAAPPVNSVDESTQANQAPHQPIRLRGPRAVVNFCKGVLQESGEPLTRGQLMAELEAKGTLELYGKDRESRARYVGTVLWRHPKEIEHIEGKGYWLKGVNIPETEAERRALRQSETVWNVPSDDSDTDTDD
jgi:hypothetical protein